MAGLEFIDTHCHIHEEGYEDPRGALDRAHDGGVHQVVCVGTSEESSAAAISFSQLHEGVYAAIGVHPHDTKDGWTKIAELAKEHHGSGVLVAIGEIGLDYFYTLSNRETQIEALKAQLQTAVDYDLPVIFHVRDGAEGEASAFADFWPIFDSFHYASGEGLRGELHSFTDSEENLMKGLERGLYIGVNGISTFSKDVIQRAMWRAIPLERMLLETDAPFLTPTPYRGKINEPAFVRNVAENYVTQYRPDEGLSVADIALETTANARTLFRLPV